MSALRILRISARVALPLGIASSAIAIAAAPALAASSVSVTGDSSGVVDHQTTLSIVGHYDNSGSLSSKTVNLVVTDPSGNDHTLWTGTARAASTGSSPSISFNTECEPWTSCAMAVNGAYAFRVDVGSTSSSVTSIRFNIPPAAVQGFSGQADGTVATFSWNPNSEPDLVDYDLRSGGSDVTQGGLDPSSVCDSSGCSVSVQFGSSVSGTQQQFVMVARRRSASGGLLASPDSTTTVTFPAAPSPAPSGKPGSTGGGGGSGTTTGGGGGSTSGGGSGTSGKTSSGRTLGKHPAADLRTFLPTVTAGNAPDLPSVITEVKPLPMGTYKPLVYPDRVKREAVHSGHNGVAAAVVGDLANVVDSGPLWRALAGAAVLMLVAAHLRAWVERTDVVD